MTSFNNQGSTSNQANAQTFNGPTNFNFGGFSHQGSIGHSNVSYAGFDLGLNIVHAPEMDPGHFVGRTDYLQQMKDILHPELNSVEQTEQQEQRLLILGGMGGIGKTQLSISYAKHHRKLYSSIFWLNATSKETMIASFRWLARRIGVTADMESQCKDFQIINHVDTWLSMKENNRWLLIFDNYDEPEEYQIKDYFPSTTHGSIIITTRLPEELNGEKLKVKSITDIKESLHILETRSRRENVQDDANAQLLARRLDGHPLALATAGSFLKQSSIGFDEYLRQYHEIWKVSTRRPVMLPEYTQRTLYTTWDLSFSRIQRQDPEVAKLLSFLAYFDSEDIWYELVSGGDEETKPSWLANVTSNPTEFGSAMAILVDYCLVEGQPETNSYSVHVCIHDWLLNRLTSTSDHTEYWLSLDCMTNCLNVLGWWLPLQQLDSESFRVDLWANMSSSPRIGRIIGHLVHLNNNRLQEFADNSEQLIEGKRLESVMNIATALIVSGPSHASMVWLKRLIAKEQQEPNSVLSTILRNLMAICTIQNGGFSEGEQVLKEMVDASERRYGESHSMTLLAANDLAFYYCSRGRVENSRLILTRVSEELLPFKKLEKSNLEAYIIAFILFPLAMFSSKPGLKTFSHILRNYIQAFPDNHPWSFLLNRLLGGIEESPQDLPGI